MIDRPGLFFALPCVVALAGCAPAPLRMAQPPELASVAEVFPIRGLRAGDSGYFAVAGHVGGFARGAAALTAAGLVDLRAGSVAFDIAGPELPGIVEAVCDAAQGAAGTAEQGSEEPSGTAAVCEFRLDGEPTDWVMALDRDAGDPARRVGVLAVGGLTLSLGSTEAVSGGGPRDGGPVGFVIEGEGGAVASLDLTEEPPLLRLAPSASADERRAALIAAAGLSALAAVAPPLRRV